MTYAAGDAGFCALRAPGRLLCWTRTPGNPLSPVDAVDDYVEVAVGDHHACGLRAGGEIRCLKLGGEGPPSAPQAIANLPPMRTIGVDGDRLCGLTAGGDVHCVEPDTASWPKMPLLQAPGATLLDFHARTLCVGGGGQPVRCVQPADPDGNAFSLPELADAAELRLSGLLICARDARGHVRCLASPHPTQGFGGGAPWPWSDDKLRYPRLEDADALVVTWASVCARHRGGGWRCDGVAQGEPVDTKGLGDLSGVDRLVLVSEDIGCGLDRDGELRWQHNAQGFCGEDMVSVDGNGADMAAARRAGYTADIGPRLRMGAVFRTAGPGGTGGTTAGGGFKVPLLFGTPGGFHLGPELDVATRAFGTVEPGAGLAAAWGRDFQVGTWGTLAESFGDGGTHPMVAAGLRVGGAVAMTGANCEADCGLRYVPTAGIGVELRRSLGPQAATEFWLAFDLDPAAFLIPFLLFGADWNFD